MPDSLPDLSTLLTQVSADPASIVSTEAAQVLATSVMLAQVLGLRAAEGESVPAFFTRVRETAKKFVTPAGESLYERVYGVES